MHILHQSTCRRTWLSGLGLTGLGLRMWGGSPLAATAQTKPENEPPLERETVCQAMKLAATYYRTQVARHGGYVYHYDLDLKRSWGEGEASSDQIWVQPPGTPTVGLAYLAAYSVTGDHFYLEAAQAAAEALCYGQLQSGGWTNCIDFDPQGKRVALYRNGRGGGKNNSSLDDAQTQSAILFLVRADEAFQFQHAEIHTAAEIALNSLRAAQFPCGAFPQVWSQLEPRALRAAEREFPRGNFPTIDWRSEGKLKEYWTLYTLNDNLAVSLADTLRDAYQVYGDVRCLNALRRLGDFLILAQMPHPQPAWAQQYNFQMQPVWARKFEPPAISGLESQGAIRVLIDLYRDTGDQKYLQPVPAALDYLQRSRLPEGGLARYYELQTNRPLYMQRRGEQYHLTYDDSNLPDHYAWKVADQVDELRAEYLQLRQPASRAEVASPTTDQPSAGTIQDLIEALDPHGRWLSYSQGERLVGQKVFPPGTPYLSSQLFSQNLSQLASYATQTN